MLKKSLNGVAVEKLDLSKLVEKTLRQEALQTTLGFPRHFRSPKIRLFREKWSFSTATGHITSMRFSFALLRDDERNGDLTSTDFR